MGKANNKIQYTQNSGQGLQPSGQCSTAQLNTFSATKPSTGSESTSRPRALRRRQWQRRVCPAGKASATGTIKNADRGEYYGGISLKCWSSIISNLFNDVFMSLPLKKSRDLKLDPFHVLICLSLQLYFSLSLGGQFFSIWTCHCLLFSVQLLKYCKPLSHAGRVW